MTVTSGQEAKQEFTPNAVTLLAVRAADDIGRMGELWQAVERLAGVYAAHYVRAGILPPSDVEDYMQQSYIALSEAVASYDIDSNTQFSSWLGFYLRRAMRTLSGKSADAMRRTVPTESEDEDGEAVDLFDILPDEAAETDFRAVEKRDGAKFLLRKIHTLCDERGARILIDTAKGRKKREIAADEGTNISAVSSALVRAQSKLYHDREIRSAYSEWYGETLHKSLAAFNSSWSSVVEDAVIKREYMRHCGEGGA